jgi:hypothetical protein
MIIKRVAPLSVARIAGMLYAIIGFVIGGIFSLLAVAGALIPSDADASLFGPVVGLMIGVGAIVFVPILYGALGFVVSLFGAWLYNLVAGVVGGIEIEVQ